MRNLKIKYSLLTLVFVTAGALRYYDLGFQSLWNDELATLHFAQMDLKTLFWMLQNEEVHPPLYFVLMKYWIQLLGQPSEWVLRIPSLVFGLGAIFGIFILARLMFDLKIALTAALFSALSCSLVYYSQEARPYSMLLCLFTFTAYFWVRLFSSRKFQWSRVAGFTLFAFLSCMVHYFAWFMMVLLALVTLVLLVRERDRGQAKAFGVGFLGLLVLLSFWLPTFFHHLLSKTHHWLPEAEPFEHLKYYYYFLFAFTRESYPISRGNIFFHTLIAISLVSFLVSFWRQRTTGSILVYSWLTVPFVVLLVLSTGWKNMMWDRYWIVFFPPAAIAVALGIWRIKTFDWVKIAFVGALSGFQFFYLSRENLYYSRIIKEQWRHTAQWLAKQEQRPIVVCSWSQEYFKHYFSRYIKGYNVIGNLCSKDEGIFENLLNQQDVSKYWLVYGHRIPDKKVLSLLGSEFAYSEIQRLHRAGVFSLSRKQKPDSAWSAQLEKPVSSN